MSPVNDLLLV